MWLGRRVSLTIKSILVDFLLSPIQGRENRQRERERETTSSAFADDSSSNGHNFPISHFVASTGNSSSANNYSSSRERDNFGSGNASNHHSSSSSNNRANEHGENSFNQGVRETGIIEKLLVRLGLVPTFLMKRQSKKK